MVHRAEANGVQGNDQARSTPESDGFDVVKHWNEEKKCWLVHVIAQGGQNMMVEFRGRFETEREANDEVARVKKRSHPPGNHPEAPSTAAGPRPTQDEANATLFRPPERFRQSRSTRPHLHALTDDDLNVLRDLAARKVGEYEGVMFNIDGGNWNAQACGSSTGPFPTPHAAAWAADCLRYDAGIEAVNFPELMRMKVENGVPPSGGEVPSAAAALPALDDST